MKILGEIKSIVRIENRFARDTACAVFNLADLPPARPGGIEVPRNVVRNVCDDELCFRQAVRVYNHHHIQKNHENEV